MTDTQRLDKLERIEREVRKRKFFAVSNDEAQCPSGCILTYAKKRALSRKAVGGIVYDNLRSAIDAAPEPKARKNATAGN